MFIKTIKVKKPDVFGVAIAIVFLAIVVVLICTACGKSSGNSFEMKNESQRQSFLREMGWEVPKEYDECKVVVIPEKFNDVYSNYNKLQKEQGFDLTEFAGKSAEIYTYKIKNYGGKNKNEDISCHLMVCDGKLIGGDVCSSAVDGFMQGLKKSA